MPIRYPGGEIDLFSVRGVGLASFEVEVRAPFTAAI